MTTTRWIVLAIVAVLTVAAAVFYYRQGPQPTETASAPPPKPSALAPETAQREIHYPVPPVHPENPYAPKSAATIA